MCHGVTSEKFPVFAILTMIAHRGAFRGVVKEGRQSFAYAQAPPPAACAVGHPDRQAVPRGRSAHRYDDECRRVAANDSRVIMQ